MEHSKEYYVFREHVGMYIFVEVTYYVCTF